MFVGIETATSEFLITPGRRLYKCARLNTRRVPNDKSFHVDYLEKIKATYDDYISEGASTYDPGLEPFGEGDCLGEGNRTQPGLVGKDCVPRSFKISAQDGSKYGFIEQMPGMHLATEQAWGSEKPY